MPQRIFSLEIADTELKASVLETSFRDYKVAGFHRAPLPNGSAAEPLKRFLAQHAAAGDTILSALPGDRVTWRTFFLPFRDLKKVAQTVPFELESNVPFGLDEVVVDYQILHRDRAGTTVLAALVQKEDLERHLELLQQGGADPKVVDIGPLATTAALYRDRELAGLRTLTRGSAPAPPADNGNGAAPDAADETDHEIDVEALVGELRWTFLALNGAPLEDELICYVAGDAAIIDSVERPLAAALPADVRRLDRIPLRNLAPEVGTQAPAFSSSLGLALREVSPTNTLGVNFRRGEFTFHRAQQELRQAVRGVVILGLIVVALTLVDMGVKRYQLGQQAAAVDEQVQKVLHAALPDLGHV